MLAGFLAVEESNWMQLERSTPATAIFSLYLFHLQSRIHLWVHYTLTDTHTKVLMGQHMTTQTYLVPFPGFLVIEGSDHFPRW